MKKLSLINYFLFATRCRGFVLLICVVLSTPVSAAKIYKWVDDKGVVQFTSTPPEKSNKVDVVGLTNKKKKKPVQEAIRGTWECINDDQDISVRIDSRGIRFRFKDKDSGESKSMSGIYELKGKLLEVGYKTHPKIEKVGKIEKYFINRVNEQELILIQLGSNKKFTYRKDDSYSRTKKILNKSAMRLVGGWESLTNDRAIEFKGSNFTIKEKVKVKHYWTRKKTKTGFWRYNDPYIDFTINREREVGKNTMSRVNMKIRFYIINLDEMKLKVRNEYSQIESFFKK